MSVTLANVRGRVRSAIEESTSRFWTDAEINAWVNDALRDVARRSETIQSFNTSTVVVAGTNKYSLPTNMVRVHRMEFVPAGQSQIYPLEPSNYQLMDAMWGVNQSSAGIPRYFVMWGMPPSLSVQLYPVPSVGGVLNIFYYRLPAVVAADADTLEIPEGWDDAVVDYCEAMAKRKDHDQTWVEAMQMYETKVTTLISITRQWHDQTNSIQVGRNFLPNWLYAMDE